MSNPDRCYISAWACLICANVHSSGPGPVFWGWAVLAMISFYLANKK